MAAEIRKIQFGYSSSDDLLFHEFSASFSRGLTVVKGYSGCGKTTLLRLASGLLSPNSGEITVSSCPLLVLQEDALLPWLTIHDNFSKFRATPSETLTKTKLWSLVEDLFPLRAHRLSYGQRRIAELTRALAFNPEILLLDEPFNYLDDGRVDVIIHSLLEYSRSGRTLVITTHRHDTTLDDASTVLTFVGKPPFTSLEKANQ